jgi:hypothetical protein
MCSTLGRNWFCSVSCDKEDKGICTLKIKPPDSALATRREEGLSHPRFWPLCRHVENYKHNRSVLEDELKVKVKIFPEHHAMQGYLGSGVIAPSILEFYTSPRPDR